MCHKGISDNRGGPTNLGCLPIVNEGLDRHLCGSCTFSDPLAVCCVNNSVLTRETHYSCLCHTVWLHCSSPRTLDSHTSDCSIVVAKLNVFLFHLTSIPHNPRALRIQRPSSEILDGIRNGASLFW